MIKLKGKVHTETQQAAPNGYTVEALKQGGAAAATASPDRGTGEFALTISGAKAGDVLELAVKDPMGKPVAFIGKGKPSFTVDSKAMGSGAIDAGLVQVELGPQPPVEAFAFGGKVFLTDGKTPIPNGYTMHVSTADGQRKTSEDIVDGKFALIFIDLQGSYPRIAKGDKFVFSVKDREGRDFPTEPSGWALTNTDIANSSIATLEFKVALNTK